MHLAAGTHFRAMPSIVRQRRSFLPLGRLSRVLSLLMLLLCFARGQADAQESKGASAAKAHLDRAKQMLAADNFPGARTELELSLQADPNLAEAHLSLGMVEYQIGETAQALQHLRRAVELLPDSFDAHYGLAMAQLRDRNVEDGRRELERAREINPRNPDAVYNLGIVLLGQGKAEDAARLFRETRTLGPNRPDVSFYVVYAELERRRFDEARREAEAGAKAFGKDFQWRSGVGRLFVEHGQAREALPHLEEALRLQPDSAEIRRLLATARLELRDPAGALELLAAPATAEDHYLRASALYLERRYREADQESRQALKAQPREPKFMLLEARIAQRTGQHQDALELLDQTIASAPQWPEPYYSQGVSYYLQRRYADARRSLARALELDPYSVRALFLKSACLVNEGKNREAEEVLRRALALEPANARFHYHLGALLLRDNRPDESQREFEEAIRLKPDYAPPHYQLGKLLVRSNQPERAVRELEAAVQHQADLAQGYYQLSRAYSLLGDQEKSAAALAAFDKLKKQEADDNQELMDSLRQEVEAP